MTIEEAGPDPERLAAEIHRQIGPGVGPVPVRAVAAALDIVEIKEAQTQAFEGALIMPDNRGLGAIVVNAAASPFRQRFTIGHELGHFLSLHHRPTASLGFACTTRDLGVGWAPRTFEDDLHRRQEAEANRFAIALLAPHSRMRRALVGIPDLAKVVALADELEVSREATARRYCELHPWPTALVFTKEGTVRYVDRSHDFPFVRLSAGSTAPSLPGATDAKGVSDHEAADPYDWVADGKEHDVVVQTLHQADGFAITLLAIDREREAPDRE